MDHFATDVGRSKFAFSVCHYEVWSRVIRMRGCRGTVKGEEVVCLQQLNEEDCAAAREEGKQWYEVRFQCVLIFARLAVFGLRCGGFLELLGCRGQQRVVLVFAVEWVVVCVSTLVIGTASRHRGGPASRGE